MVNIPKNLLSGSNLGQADWNSEVSCPLACHKKVWLHTLRFWQAYQTVWRSYVPGILDDVSRACNNLN